MTTEDTEITETEGQDGINKITEAVIGSAIVVHSALGPSLLESPYEACLALELVERGLSIEQQSRFQLCIASVWWM